MGRGGEGFAMEYARSAGEGLMKPKPLIASGGEWQRRPKIAATIQTLNLIRAWLFLKPVRG